MREQHCNTQNDNCTVNIWSNSAQCCHVISRYKQNMLTPQIIKIRNVTTGSSNYPRHLNNNRRSRRLITPITAQLGAGKSSLSSRPQPSDTTVAYHLRLRLSCRQTRNNENLRISNFRSVNSLKMPLSETVRQMNRTKH